MWRRTSSTPIGLKSHPTAAPEAVEAARHPGLVALEWVRHPHPVDLVGPALQPVQVGRAGPRWFHFRVAQVDPVVVGEAGQVKMLGISATSCSLFAKASPRGSPLSPSDS